MVVNVVFNTVLQVLIAGMKGGSCGVPMPMLETFEDEPKPKAATASPPQLKVNDSVLSHSEKLSTVMVCSPSLCSYT